MVLEATILVVDNSEHSRNGDYLPSRFEAQSDAVNLIFSTKTNSNPESSVGLMTMGGSQPEVLTTLTNDFGKIMEGLHRTKIRGNAHLSTALNVAQLALKHRQNKSQHQRIIVFTCSPLSEDEKTIVKLAKRMKKNNIHVDIVAFGDLDEANVKKVEAFHENIKSSAAGAGAEGSNLAIIPPGPNLLSDSIVASDILAGDGMGGRGAGAGSGGGGGGGESGGGASGGAGGGGDAGYGDVDPNMDPELAMALRLSMEEEERRLQREQREQQEREGKTPLDTVPEGEEKSGEASSSGAADKKEDSDKKDGDQDKMDTA